MRTIPQRQLRNDNAAILDEVAAGESFIITRNGTPIAELRPVASAPRTFVPRSAVARVAAAGPHIDARAFRADLDSLVDQSLP